MKTLLLTMTVLAATAFGGDRGLLITKIHHGDYWISIFSTKGGTRYDVNSPSGDLLAENATVDQLRTKVPAVYQFMKSSIAIDAGNEDTTAPKVNVLDAGSDNL